MPVYKIREEMPYEEFLQWEAYFDKRPAGWQEDHRAYKLMQAFGVKEKPGAVFLSLDKLTKNPEPAQDGMISAANLKSSAMFAKMLGATGGVKLELS